MRPPRTFATLAARVTASAGLVALIMVSLAGCAQLNQLRAMKAFKDANQAYQRQDYKTSAQLYEAALHANPDLVQAYFYLGNSYDNLWKPGKKGDAANDALLVKAADSYQSAAEKLSNDRPENAKLKTLSLQYLVATYGADKLNEPAKAAPVVERMIQMDPSDPQNYFVLAKIYEDANDFAKAEQTLQQAKQAKPGDPAVFMQLAGFYNRRGQFDKTIDALRQRAAMSPNDPEAFYTIASYYWDKTFRDKTLKENVKRDYTQKGLEAIDRALQIKPDYAEAVVFKGLLLRLEAALEKDRSKQLALLKQAEELQKKAETLRRQKAAG
jgi:tetratricopeptide (TPR) repeat protein